MSAARLLPFTLAVACLPLAGCMSLSGNIKGSFSCSAPGGTCAPSSVIDDRALAMISGAADVLPAGPAAPARQNGDALRIAGTGPVTRTKQKVLKIVFPAHVDAQGRYHETAAIRTVVDDGIWVAAAEPRVMPTASTALTASTEAYVGRPAGGNASAVVSPPPSEDAVRAKRERLPDGAEPTTMAAREPTVASGAGVREALKAEVDRLLAKPGAAAAPTRKGEQEEDRPQGSPPKAPVPVNRPASFNGSVED